jgi:hypothetical protein
LTHLYNRLKYCFHSSVFGFNAAFANVNVSTFTESPVKEQIEATAAAIQAKINNSTYTMLGDNFNIMQTVFRNSKSAGKTWQIWGGGTSEYIIA